MNPEDLFENEENSSEEEEDPVLDEDICSRSKIDAQFSTKFFGQSKAATSLKNYILHLCTNRSFTKIACGIANGTVQIFDISHQGLNWSRELKPFNESANICGVQFLDDETLLLGEANGSIHLIDLRISGIQSTYEDTSSEERKSITCFDTNANNRLICAGTEEIMTDVYLLFFDIRSKALLGGYWESHQDDVTQVKFHPKNPDLLVSGSTDGLINIFDISKPTEDDALKIVINTESSVEKLNWHKNVYEKDILSCITHTNDLKIYEVEEGDLISDFSRSDVTTAIKRKSVSDCNLISCHNMEDGTTFLLAGSNFNKGEVLRSLKIQNKTLLPLANFEDNRQIVRDSVFDSKSNILITSGESGIVTFWTNKEGTEPADSYQFKAKRKIISKIHNTKPY